MDKLFLNIILSLLKLFPLKGVDKEQLRVIASTKVLMDRRRKPATWRRGKDKDTSNAMLVAMFLYGFLGLFISIMIFTVPSIMLVMIIIHSYFLFMLVMTMITDFSNVLLDTSDSQIILPKPVTSRTFLLARTVHIIVYLSQLVLALMIFPIIFTFIRYGLVVGFGMLFTTLLTTGLGIFLTYILYGLVLRFTSEEKVKDIISYFQIFMTIFFAVGYQIVPRLIDLDQLSFTFSFHWYSYLLPPVWMAAFLEALHEWNFDAIHLAMIACAVGVPLLSGWLVAKFLAPYFSKSISRLNTNHSKSKAGSVNMPVSAISEKLAPMVCKGNYEKAAFGKVWKITSRDKGFRMQFYPALAYIPVFIFVIFFRKINNISETVDSLPETNMYLWLLYLAVFSVTTGLQFMKYYENSEAAWIYQSSPLSSPGHIITGGMKVLLVKFFFPVYIILAGIAIAVWGVKIADDVLLAFANNILIFYMVEFLSKHYIPFSQQQNAKEQSGRFVLMIIQMVLIAVLVGLHYLALQKDWLVLALIPVSLAGVYFANKSIRRLQWNKIVI